VFCAARPNSSLPSHLFLLSPPPTNQSWQIWHGSGSGGAASHDGDPGRLHRHGPHPDAHAASSARLAPLRVPVPERRGGVGVRVAGGRALLQGQPAPAPPAAAAAARAEAAAGLAERGGGGGGRQRQGGGGQEAVLVQEAQGGQALVGFQGLHPVPLPGHHCHQAQPRRRRRRQRAVAGRGGLPPPPQVLLRHHPPGAPHGRAADACTGRLAVVLVVLILVLDAILLQQRQRVLLPAAGAEAERQRRVRRRRHPGRHRALQALAAAAGYGDGVAPEQRQRRRVLLRHQHAQSLLRRGGAGDVQGDGSSKATFFLSLALFFGERMLVKKKKRASNVLSVTDCCYEMQCTMCSIFSSPIQNFSAVDLPGSSDLQLLLCSILLSISKLLLISAGEEKRGAVRL
jgi:hypothetical protein